MATYQTEQKKELVRFLKKHSNQAFTIDQICKEMAGDSACICPPGRSTVYRLIPKLLSENLIKQFKPSKGGKTVYQIIGGIDCKCHIHLKCTSCGKIFHMSNEITESMCSLISRSNEFKINMEETVLYGICHSCAEKGA